MPYIAIFWRKKKKEKKEVFGGELCPLNLACFGAWIINELLLLLFVLSSSPPYSHPIT